MHKIFVLRKAVQRYQFGAAAMKRHQIKQAWQETEDKP
jgi:hypothetical protein